MFDKLPRGLSANDRVEFGLKASIFSAEERAWLESPELYTPVTLPNFGVQPPIDQFVAVTSLSVLPKHQVVQPECLDTWAAAGLSIVAVNRPDEIELIHDKYPQVSVWIESTDINPIYSFPTQRINVLLGVALRLDTPILLINSDIQIRGSQQRLLNILDAGKVGVGIRYNFEGHWRNGVREGWGLDAFLMNQEQVATLPQFGFAIGRPMWDYWLPFHFERYKCPMEWIGEAYFFHSAHPVHWLQEDLDLGMKWMREHYIEVDDSSELRLRWPYHVYEAK